MTLGFSRNSIGTTKYPIFPVYKYSEKVQTNSRPMLKQKLPKRGLVFDEQITNKMPPNPIEKPARLENIPIGAAKIAKIKQATKLA